MSETNEKKTASLIDRLDTDAESFQQALIKSFTEFEKDFRRRYPWFWLVALVGPVVFTVILLVFIGLIFGWAQVWDYLAAAAWTFFLLGRFAIAGSKVMILPSGDPFTPYQAFCMLCYMDIMVALFVTFHMGLLFRIPWLGPKIGALVYDGKFILESNPWMQRIAFLGLIIFVIFPTSTTGSIGGSIFGRLLGLSRMWTLTGIAIGSVLGNGLMLLIGNSIKDYIDPSNMYVRVFGIAIIVLIIFAIEYRYRKLKKRYLESKEK